MMDSKEKHREEQRRYREKNRKKINDQNRLYRLLHPEKMCQWRKEWNQRNILIVRKAVKEWHQKNPEKVASERLARNMPIKPASFCELCPEDNVRTENLHRHHPDHNFPEIFITVCPSCHKYAEQGV